MTLDSQLTILLTLKDRVPFSRRWMEYAECFRLPFKVFIADGGADDGAQTVLSNRTAFPAVDYEYIRYPPDQIYTRDYWAKIADALTRIRTPFVALADNDDLFVIDGVRRAIHFLVDHADYASCGGQSAVFWLTPSPEDTDAPCYGKRIRWKSAREERSPDAETARARIGQLSIHATDSSYHYVRRTDQLRTQVAAIRDAGLHDFFLIERLLLWLTAIAGKTQRLDTVYVARQWNTVDSAGEAHTAERGDWFGRMLTPTWSQDFEAFVRITSAALAAQDRIAIDEARAAVVELYREWLAPHLVGDLGAEPTVAMTTPIMIRVVQIILNLSPDNVFRRAARSVYRRTRWISVDAVHGTELRARDVPNASAAFRPIAEFLANGVHDPCAETEVRTT